MIMNSTREPMRHPGPRPLAPGPLARTVLSGNLGIYVG
jgi:hypothetical protein